MNSVQLGQAIREFSVWVLPLVLSITLHEAAHGFAALRFGDDTAQRMGRISANPLRHVDPFGTLLLPALLLLSGSNILFGWAKPVPVNFAKLRHPKRDMLWVAAAGPFSNLLMAFVWGLVFKFGDGLAGSNPAATWLILVGACGIFVNVVFCVLNLLPLPPLDGGRIAVSLLPHRAAWRFAQIEQFGLIILIVLLVTGLLGKVLWPLIHFFMSIIGAVLGIAPDQILRLMTTL